MDLLASLPLFDIAVCDYLIFLWVFALSALAVLGLDELRQGRGATLFVAATVASTMAVIAISALRSPGLRELGMSAEYLRARRLLQVVPLLAALVMVWPRARRLPLGTTAAAALVVLFVGQRTLEEARVHPSYPARAFYPPLPLLAPVPRGQPVRIAGVHYVLTPNAAALYGLEDVRGYSPMAFGPLAETFGLWCVPLPAFYNRVDDPTAPFLAFLNARYVLAPPGYPAPEGWKVTAEDRGGRLFENPRALPRVFVPRHLAWTADPRMHLQVMQTIWDFANDGVAGRARPGPLAWRDNGEADVRIVSYAAERIVMAIDARTETFVGTSIPGWPGWRLAIDGKDAPLVFFNRAFLGFEVPPGRHEAVLRYLPDGFVYGAAITLGTLVLCAGLLLHRRAGT
jgi:hypothetical protein